MQKSLKILGLVQAGRAWSPFLKEMCAKEGHITIKNISYMEGKKDENGLSGLCEV
jgi:hypothetical protein